MDTAKYPWLKDRGVKNICLGLFISMEAVPPYSPRGVAESEKTYASMKIIHTGYLNFKQK